ncbi:hypothetical protein EAO76_20015 [Streptomyces sp. sk2.1]|nr:hypothetical protein EAO76_20015 [Streptomyces sp. sk2.1]
MKRGPSGALLMEYDPSGAARGYGPREARVQLGQQFLVDGPEEGEREGAGAGAGIRAEPEPRSGPEPGPGPRPRPFGRVFVSRLDE